MGVFAELQPNYIQSSTQPYRFGPIDLARLSSQCLSVVLESFNPGVTPVCDVHAWLFEPVFALATRQTAPRSVENLIERKR